MYYSELKHCYWNIFTNVKKLLWNTKKLFKKSLKVSLKIQKSQRTKVTTKAWNIVKGLPHFAKKKKKESDCIKNSKNAMNENAKMNSE